MHTASPHQARHTRIAIGINTLRVMNVCVCVLSCEALPAPASGREDGVLNCPARSPTCPGCETHTALPGPNHTAKV